MKLNARQLREVDENEAKVKLKNLKRRPIYFILENIYDTYNIGGLFRLADALAIEKIYLCGETEIPPNSRIKKASIGTYKIVPWEYCKSASEAIADLKSKIKNQKSKLQIKIQKSGRTSEVKEEAPAGADGKTSEVNETAIRIITIEQHKKSIPYTKANYSLPLALIVGNETYGITPETLKLADQIIEIPMWGINKSLNVIVSAAIVGYWAVNKVQR